MNKNFFGKMIIIVLFATQVACAATATQSSVKKPIITVYPTVTAQSTATPMAQTSLWRGNPTYFSFDPKWTIEFEFLNSDWNLVVGARSGQFDQLIHRTLTGCVLLGGTKAGDLTSDYRVDRSIQTLGKTNYELSKVVRTKDSFVEYVNYCANKDISNALSCYMLQLGDHAVDCTRAAEQVLGTMRLEKP
jgi:hypothetical protein